MTKILAESLHEFRQMEKSAKINEEQLNESVKAKLEKYLSNPEKYEKRFYKAFGPWVTKMKPIVGKEYDQFVSDIKDMSPEDKKKMAEKAVAYLESNPGLDQVQMPWKKVDGKIVIDVDGEISGSGKGGREGIHGGKSTKV